MRMTSDARIVIKQFPLLEEKILIVENCLFYSLPKMFSILYKKHNNIMCVLKILKNGYFKNFNRGFLIDFERIGVHYFYLTNYYLTDDVPYSHLKFLNEIAKYDISLIKKTIDKIDIVALPYLLAVLKNNFNYIPLVMTQHKIVSKGKVEMFDVGVKIGSVEI